MHLFKKMLSPPLSSGMQFPSLEVACLLFPDISGRVYVYLIACVQIFFFCLFETNAGTPYTSFWILSYILLNFFFAQNHSTLVC